MGKFIQDVGFLNKNIDGFHDMLESPLNRLQEMPPTYVTYYNISNTESLSDLGFLNFEESTGENSPLRFNEIKKLPVYGLEQILVDLEDADEGLQTSYEGEGILLPNTIKPLPNDMFVIEYLRVPTLFRVNDIKYDTLKNDNYYKIQFQITKIDVDWNLDRQICGRYTCEISNLGTNKDTIIEDDTLKIINGLREEASKLQTIFDTLFYSEKYNSYIFGGIGASSLWNPALVFDAPFYDRAQAFFIQSNLLFYDPAEIKTKYLSNEDDDRTMTVEYEQSFYKVLEKRNRAAIAPLYQFSLKTIPNLGSVFEYYRDRSYFIRLREIFGGSFVYIDPVLTEGIRTNMHTGNDTYDFIIDYFGMMIQDVDQLDITFLTDIFFRKYTFENFILMPIIIYILKSYIDEFSV